MNTSVAIVIESLGGGGAQHVASTLANAWAAAGISVTVITFQEPATDVFKLDPRVKREVIGGVGASSGALSALWANIDRVRRLRAALKRCKTDVVIGFVASTNVLTILAGQGLGCRMIVSERNDPVLQSIGRAWSTLRRLFYRRADLVVANSRAAIEAMRAYVPAERLLWLPNPLRTPPESDAPSAPPIAGPFLLSVGRLSPAKGYDVLLAAFARLHVRRPDLHLAILGEGPLRGTLEAQAKALGLSDRVRFAGYVSDPFPWYRAAMALVHPARFEGLPNVVIEAMSVGLPVLVSDAQSGLRDFVRNGETGLVVKTDGPAALVDAMAMLADDPALRRKLGDAGGAAVELCRADKAVAAWTEALGLTRVA